MLRSSPHIRLLALIALLPACTPEAQGAEAEPLPSAPAPAAPVSTPFCGEGWRAIDDSTCVALPERFASPPSLVIFAHGILAPGALPTGDQATLLAAARAHGFAVLFPRGKPGLCTWEPGVTSSFCWPTKRETVDEESPKILAEWASLSTRAEELAGVRFERRYHFGFSNGGYFIAYLTVEGRAPIDGAGVVGAGRTTIDESLFGAAQPPFYLAVGDQEAATTQSDASNLARTLTVRGWPLTFRVHSGRGHELNQDDLAAAWTRWGR